jgi:hypothetical protein
MKHRALHKVPETDNFVHHHQAVHAMNRQDAKNVNVGVRPDILGGLAVDFADFSRCGLCALYGSKSEALYASSMIVCGKEFAGPRGRSSRTGKQFQVRVIAAFAPAA